MNPEAFLWRRAPRMRNFRRRSHGVFIRRPAHDPGGMPLNDREEIAEFVSDFGRHPANPVEAPRRLKLLLYVPDLGDVLDRASDAHGFAGRGFVPSPAMFPQEALGTIRQQDGEADPAGLSRLVRGP